MVIIFGYGLAGFGALLAITGWSGVHIAVWIALIVVTSIALPFIAFFKLYSFVEEYIEISPAIRLEIISSVDKRDLRIQAQNYGHPARIQLNCYLPNEDRFQEFPLVWGNSGETESQLYRGQRQYAPLLEIRDYADQSNIAICTRTRSLDGLQVQPLREKPIDFSVHLARVMIFAYSNPPMVNDETVTYDIYLEGGNTNSIGWRHILDR